MVPPLQLQLPVDAPVERIEGQYLAGQFNKPLMPKSNLKKTIKTGCKNKGWGETGSAIIHGNLNVLEC